MANQRSLLVYFAACFLLFFAITAKQLTAQSTTGTISGSVNDPSGGIVPGATVTLTSEGTGEARSATANASGEFNFAAVQAGSYSLKVEHAGFKGAEQKGVVVVAMNKLSIGTIQLQVGAVSETIEVQENVEQVETDNSQVTGDISGDTLTSLTGRGRDVVSLLRIIPGVTYAADLTSAGGTYGTSTMNIAGTQAPFNHIAVDGVTSNDQGDPRTFSSATMLDAIGEVKVILNSYQAEYAGNGGIIMQIITKSGTKSYHGTLYDFVRNEDFNANTFFNNRAGSNSLGQPSAPRQRYRYNTPGGTLGGPIYVPGHWNTKKTKLFGFYNMDIQYIHSPGPLTNYTMPSALERMGDFSQTVQANQTQIAVNDPLAGGTQFPGNIIPSSRMNANGVALMNTLPLPNYNNLAVSLGAYNYQTSEIVNQPTRAQVFKIDYVPTDKDRFYVRGKTYLSEDKGYSVPAGASPIGFFGQCYCFSEEGIAVVGTHIFSPTIVLEYNTGVRHNHEGWAPYGENGRTDAQELQLVERSHIGFTAGQWFPQSNPNGFIPKYSFGGVSNGPSVSYDPRLLSNGTDFGFNADASVSIVHGNHLIKFGADFLRDREYEGEQSTFAGSFSFATDVNNPFDSHYAYSNAFLGNFDSYSESNTRYGANIRQSTMEWYLQDTWKVTRNLTINAGLRETYAQQPYPRYPTQVGQFAMSQYSPSQVPPLYGPVIANGVRQAQNPVTGALLPAAYIGLFVPGIGNPAPGSITPASNPSYPRGFVNQWGILQGPRLGFAWDPFGKGRTAIRGGAAILYSIRTSKSGNWANHPPATFSPTAYYGNLNTFLQSQGTLGPGSAYYEGVNDKAPDNYNLSFGVQQDLSHGFLLDVSYAGTLGQHIAQTQNLETLPLGAQFLPQNQDPTSPGKPLPSVFFENIPGYSSITAGNNAYNSNYHAMFLTINRKFSHNLQMGITETLSKYLDYTGIPLYNNLRAWSYGVDSSDARNNVAVNYVYTLPNLSKVTGAKNLFVRLVGDGWSITGISQFVSGTPASISFSTVQGTNLTGGGDGQRVNVVGNPNANGSTFNAWFNTAAFALPPGNSNGNASKNSVRNPGVNNDDMTVQKRFFLKSEQRYLQFRWEAYNVFNHTQYAGIATSEKFDLTTGLNTTTNFGTVTSARGNRVCQAVLRLVF